MRWPTARRAYRRKLCPATAHHWYPKKRATLGAALVLTAPGIPMLFQGQAMLADGFFSDDQPLDWSRAEEHSGLVHLYRDLIALRRNLHGTTRGLIGPAHGGISRQQRGQDRGLPPLGPRRPRRRNHHSWPTSPTPPTRPTALGCPRPGQWQVRFNSDWEGYDQEFGNFESFGAEADRRRVRCACRYTPVLGWRRIQS